jgi:hypothetical protein
MIRTATPLIALVVAVVSAAAFPAWAQEGRALDARDNPFLPTTTEEEDRRIAERERMRQVFREMLPEVKSIVQVEVNGLRQQVNDEAKKSALEALKADPTLQAVQAGTLQANAMASPGGLAKPGEAPVAAAAVDRDGHRSKLPDGAKFLVCVQNKALYRDAKDGTRFFYDAPRGTSSPCSG